MSAVEELRLAKDCPNCKNIGWYPVLYNQGEAAQEQCEFCYTEEKSRFNVTNRHAERLDALEAENERLERLVYVPGVWVCAKCKLSLVSTLLDVSRGLFAANKEPQQCPNGCGPLWRKTERDAGNELCIRIDELAAENERLRADLDTAQQNRDRDWVLAMAYALGTDSGHDVPIVPKIEPIKALFDAVRATARNDALEEAANFLETSPAIRIADVRGCNTRNGLVEAVRALKREGGGNG